MTLNKHVEIKNDICFKNLIGMWNNCERISMYKIYENRTECKLKTISF